MGYGFINCSRTWLLQNDLPHALCQSFCALLSLSLSLSSLQSLFHPPPLLSSLLFFFFLFFRSLFSLLSLSPSLIPSKSLFPRPFPLLSSLFFFVGFWRSLFDWVTSGNCSEPTTFFFQSLSFSLTGKQKIIFGAWGCFCV